MNKPIAQGSRPGSGAKARIERAAADLFAERGADIVTTREIAAAAGVSEGAIYRHFPSKTALAASLRAAQLGRLTDAIRQRAAPAKTVEEQAAALVDAYVEAAAEDWALFCYALLTANHDAPPEAADPVGETEKRVQRAMNAGALPKGNAALKAAMATGAILQIARHKKEGRLSGELSRHADAMKTSLCAILSA